MPLEFSHHRHRGQVRAPLSRAGFTLVEALMALALAGIVIVGLFIYFGFTMQTFTQQESTLTSAQTAQILLSYLRTDLTAADGMDVSITATTGTTFPKSAVHLIQSLGSDQLGCYIHVRTVEPNIRPGNDPILDPIPPLARTGVWLKQLEILTDHPLHIHFPPGNRSNDVLRALNYAMNAAAWIVPKESEGPRYFRINVRDGTLTSPITYEYVPERRLIRRFSPAGVTTIGYSDVESFSISPIYEFLVDPDQPNGTAELIRLWYEIGFSVRAEQAGGTKIAKRALPFATRITPKYLNSVIKSRWGI